ncbi:MAG: hypothetical protein JSU03_10905 [Bacteroidetes bacterium]|nr:hypothetical protein [Bacteroidota bacterium]MBS1757778.1 hypothetical protein [Bacteroidota bacterium]
MGWLRFILSHSIFISFCAVALCFQTDVILHNSSDIHIYGFVFFATLSSYNFYWLISKFSFSKERALQVFIKKNFSYLSMFSVAAIGMLYCIYFLPYLYLYVAIAILLTLLYSLPLWPFKFASFARKAGFLKTTLLSFTWAYVTVIFPAIPVLHTDPLLVITLFAARFFFMLLLCVIFDMRDMAIDKIHALHSLATDVSHRNLTIIINIIFLLYAATGIWVRIYFKDNPQVIAFAITGIIVWIVYRFSFKKQGYFFYYFLVDGLMMVSALATYIAANFHT